MSVYGGFTLFIVQRELLCVLHLLLINLHAKLHRRRVEQRLHTCLILLGLCITRFAKRLVSLDDARHNEVALTRIRVNLLLA